MKSLFLFIAFLNLLSTVIYAAPTSSLPVTDSPSVIPNPHSLSGTSRNHSTSLFKPTHSHSRTVFRPTPTRRPSPPPPFVHHNSPPASQSPVPPQRIHRGQRPITIFFEVICGIAAIVVLASIIRCLHIYRKTPNRDRIAAIVHRHELQRELEELQRNPPLFRHTSLREPPPPPYIPPPPEYNRIVSSGSQTTDCSGVQSSSPPNTPPRSPEPAFLSSPTPPHLRPPLLPITLHDPT